MDQFANKTVVITGAASGIGRAIADRCAAERMHVVLADIEEAPLHAAAEELTVAGARVLAVQTDVADFESVNRLADACYAEFGTVDLLFNNAGVGTAGFVWESSIEDWRWVLGVNLFGVIHGINVFVPRMLAQNTACHVVNTASIAGMIAGPGMAVYSASKHAVVAISETLYHELTEVGAQIGVSVLCPAWVKTRILECARNRTGEPVAPPESLPKWMEARRQAIEGGISPSYVADCVFDAVNANRFYIFTHPEAMPLVQLRMDGILACQNPVNPATAAAQLLASASGRETGS